MSKHHRSFTYLLPILLCMCVLLLAVSSCANATAAGVNTNAPTTLQATRTNPAFYPMPPFQRTIDDATAVQRLYVAALALPKAQPGVYNCPDGPDVHYQLRFLRNGILTTDMNDNASGCQGLRIGANDIRVTTPAFRTLLAQTLGLTKLT